MADDRYTPRAEEVARYHAHAAGCPHCAHWAGKEAELQSLERMVARRPWWQRLLRRLLFVCAVLTVPTAAQAVPSCIYTPEEDCYALHGQELMSFGGRDGLPIHWTEHWVSILLPQIEEQWDAHLLDWLHGSGGPVPRVVLEGGHYVQDYLLPDEPLTHSPEPATVALVLTTAGWIGWRRWRAG